MEHRGGCHCGNLSLTLRLSQPPAEVRLRACGCSFCRAHNTRTTSDPEGVGRDPGRGLVAGRSRTGFGSGTAEFLLCRRCGVYIGAVCDTPAGLRATINTNSLDDRARFTEHGHRRRP